MDGWFSIDVRHDYMYERQWMIVLMLYIGMYFTDGLYLIFYFCFFLSKYDDMNSGCTMVGLAADRQTYHRRNTSLYKESKCRFGFHVGLTSINGL